VIYSVAKVDGTYDRAIYALQPSVPEEALSQHLSGAGVFRVYIWRDGTVRQINIARSTGHAILDKAAVDALTKWRFTPHTVLQVMVVMRFGANYPEDGGRK
jgi:protein TonB